MLVALIDNYDSFTFNLVHYIRETGVNTVVYRNDKVSIDDLKALSVDAIVISPGPGRPEDAGISLDVVKHFSGMVPLLGVCLGHQVIAQCFGGKIIQASRIMHGKTSMIESDGENIYSGIENPFTVMRYHSLAVSKENFPDCLKITSWTQEGEIMGIRHKVHPTQGVQFHPESFMTDMGKKLMENFIRAV